MKVTAGYYAAYIVLVLAGFGAIVTCQAIGSMRTPCERCIDGAPGGVMSSQQEAHHRHMQLCVEICRSTSGETEGK